MTWPDLPEDRLRRFFELMDSDDAGRTIDHMDPALEFTVLFSTGKEDPVTEFNGGMPEWREYLAWRPKENRPWHDLHLVSGGDGVAMALGYTRLGDEIAALFTAVLAYGEDGRITRYFAGRSPTLRLT